MEKISERHPLTPFLPDNAEVLLLGSFPPKHERWSMEFFYPNIQNDMWRIMGHLFYADKSHFVVEKRFDKERIVAFCKEKGIALFDSAVEVVRLKDNASDQFLEIVSQTDILSLIAPLSRLKAIVATGEKAAQVIAGQLECAVPKVGENIPVEIAGRKLLFWRMPSSSRAYPLSVERKSECYAKLFREKNCG